MHATPAGTRLRAVAHALRSVRSPLPAFLRWAKVGRACPEANRAHFATDQDVNRGACVGCGIGTHVCPGPTLAGQLGTIRPAQ